MGSLKETVAVIYFANNHTINDLQSYIKL